MSLGIPKAKATNIAKSAYQILLIPSPYLLHFRLGKGVFDHFGLVVSDQCDAKGNNI
jgi:hypothetical protein